MTNYVIALLKTIVPKDALIQANRYSRILAGVNINKKIVINRDFATKWAKH